MLKKRHCLLLFLIGGCIYGCITPRYMYAPSPPNVPELREKGDVHASALLAGGENGQEIAGMPGFNRGYELQGAWAFTKQFAVQGQLGRRYERDNYSWDREVRSTLYTRKYWDIGLGYFQTFGRKKDVTYEVFLGGGKGLLWMDDLTTLEPQLYSRYLDSDLSNFYIQQSLFVNAGRIFQLFLSGKINFIQYKNTVTNYDGGELADYGLNVVSNGSFSRSSLEGTTGMRFSYPKFPYISLQVSGTLALGWINHRNTCWAAGVNFKPAGLFHRSKKQSAD